MRDLSRPIASPRRDLRRAGVTALKIEGRLKTADWVGQAVRLYRRAMEGEDAAELVEAAKALRRLHRPREHLRISRRRPRHADRRGRGPGGETGDGNSG